MAETRNSLRQVNYTLSGVSNCKFCDERIEWWKTAYGGKLALNLAKAPGPAANDEHIVKHADTCKHSKSAPREPKTDARRAELAQRTAVAAREQFVEKLADTTRARIVVALYDDGHVARWRTDITTDDLAHELITEANRIRREAATSKGAQQ